MSRSFRWAPHDPPPPPQGGISLAMAYALARKSMGGYASESLQSDEIKGLKLGAESTGWLCGVKDSHGSDSDLHENAQELLDAIAAYHTIVIRVVY